MRGSLRDRRAQISSRTQDGTVSCLLSHLPPFVVTPNSSRRPRSRESYWEESRQLGHAVRRPQPFPQLKESRSARGGRRRELELVIEQLVEVLVLAARGGLKIETPGAGE